MAALGSLPSSLWTGAGAGSGRVQRHGLAAVSHGFRSLYPLGPASFGTQAHDSTTRRDCWRPLHAWQSAFGPLILPPHPEPVLFPRRLLNMKFAVLLMRSCYEAVDALDFIPMDRFQVKFWKLRRDEVEPYTLQYRSTKIKYGDLTDPLYFDFISFAQFATISNEMRVGELVFQEKLGVDGELRTVRRDERFKDNSTLPAAFYKVAGDLIYARLLNGFEGQAFDAPLACTSSSPFTEVVEGVQKLLQVFVDKGYALKASVDDIQVSGNSGKFRVRLEGPATLWGSQELASRNSSVSTHFEVFAIDAYMRASRRVAVYSVEDSRTSTESSWSVT